MAMIAALEDKVIDYNSLINTGKGELKFLVNIKLKIQKEEGME